MCDTLWIVEHMLPPLGFTAHTARGYIAKNCYNFTQQAYMLSPSPQAIISSNQKSCLYLLVEKQTLAHECVDEVHLDSSFSRCVSARVEGIQYKVCDYVCVSELEGALRVGPR